MEVYNAESIDKERINQIVEIITERVIETEIIDKQELKVQLKEIIFKYITIIQDSFITKTRK
ncbi:hypothetical protein [Halanaerobacter jeridensis]|uniref:Uncharacterized protein n=1 Tax=Halanaerobacter jeridensis TaxID=706427 RepID=A0A939BR72_9FIRM|nr:hypothetical protein [Halanaerobacter jeridensis]MBM7555696.1 hypothetical protein [Halanaerobacter jeridensis]